MRAIGGDPWPVAASGARAARPDAQRLSCSHPYLITLTFFATDTNEANKHIGKLCNYDTLREFMRNKADLSQAEFMMLPTTDKLGIIDGLASICYRYRIMMQIVKKW